MFQDRIPILVQRLAIIVQRMSIVIQRLSIKVKRCPIIDREARKKRMMEKVKQVRDQINAISAKEQDILDIAHYYDYKCRKATGKMGWRSLGKNFREHQNWRHFTKVYKLCTENDWDFKVYLDSQFDRVRYWQHTHNGYPFPNQMYSTNAIKCYYNYIKDYQERFSVTGDAKVKTETAKAFRDEVIETVIKDCDHFTEFFKTAPRQRRYKGLTPEQMKFMYVVDHIASLSRYYWASLPWAVSYLKRFTTPWVVELTEAVKKIQSSKSMVDTITYIVQEVENQLGIPHTVLLEA